MKSLLTTCIILLLATAAQSQTKTFVRIFDEQGRKTHKGYIINTSDSSLTISLNKETLEIPANQITVIKLKRSFVHTVLITTLISGTSWAILGAGYALAEGALAGLIVGGAEGIATGSFIAGMQNRPVFIVDRKQEQWMKVRDMIRQHYPVPENQTTNSIPNQTR